MADELADLQAQLTALRANRAAGVSRFRFRSGETEREVGYRTDQELAAAISDIEGRIAALQSGPPRILKITASKGM